MTPTNELVANVTCATIVTRTTLEFYRPWMRNKITRLLSLKFPLAIESCPLRIKTGREGGTETARQASRDPHNKVIRCGNHCGLQSMEHEVVEMSSQMREWTRRPASQKRRGILCRWYDGRPFDQKIVQGRREESALLNERSIASYLLSSTDKFTSQQVFNHRPIRMTQPCFRCIVLC